MTKVKALKHQLCNESHDSPMDVVFSVCGKIIVDDQGNLLDIDTTCLRKSINFFIIRHHSRGLLRIFCMLVSLAF